MRSIAIPALLVTMGLTGCKNACQDICLEMAVYADECGNSVTDDEVDACLESQKEISDATKDVCSEFGDSETIRVEWSCEELDQYWAAGGATTSTTGS